ncbi:MAG: DnaJ domain-containing protein [Flavobacteriales bacterium]|nr:DnaJ domain-containing protein [Flavobacteriales bacterium]
MRTEPNSPYHTLGITPNAGRQEIKRAFRRLAMKHHPDRDPSPNAAEHFRSAYAAYMVLMEWDHDREPKPERGTAFNNAPISRNDQRPMRRERPPTRAERTVFIGLHVTGLCFGLALVFSVCLGIVLGEQSPAHLVLTLPGLVVIPDSISGLRRT